ncbi:MAG: hypothetical protein ACOYKM_03605 [Caulobacterales bacterium]
MERFNPIATILGFWVLLITVSNAVYITIETRLILSGLFVALFLPVFLSICFVSVGDCFASLLFGAAALKTHKNPVRTWVWVVIAVLSNSMAVGLLHLGSHWSIAIIAPLGLAFFGGGAWDNIRQSKARSGS